MYHRLAALLLVLTPAASFAQEKPNTLTPKEIADGWVLLFDGETTFGWKSSKLKAVDGSLMAAEEGQDIITTTQFANYKVIFEYLPKLGSRARLSVACTPDGKPASARNGSIELPVLDEGWHLARIEVRAGLLRGGVFRSYGKKVGFDTGKKKAFTLKSFDEKSPPITGHVLFSGNGLRLRNIMLLPLDTTPIFNGKDLTGWREFPGKKSKFIVTDKGEINVKDGPGDLQTTGKYGDFILQLDCISNGKHLNSGVFFRCRDNEYQNGYEAQVRNQFTAEPTQEYLLEEYDPQTNKLIEKKKAKYTAVDFGTGAIYRRQPARKQMSRDGEWFTMTVVAHGNHFATWVNGVQVTDWTDNRPPSDNARTGYRQAPGHISLQGHDPTTDLSFRNFRIAELPRAEKK